MRFKYTLFIILLFANARLIAQNNTSPYSIIGIGDIEQSVFDRSSGMAGAGVSLSSPLFILSNNPASNGRLMDHFFSLELAAKFKSVSYSGNPKVTSINTTSTTSSDIQFEKISLGIKVKKWWGASIGLQPFSNSNYSFHSPKAIIGSSMTIPAYYSGEGGMNQLFFSNGFNLTKQLSVGIQASYLFGSMSQQEDLRATKGFPIITKRDIYLHKGYFKAGVLYNTKIADKWLVGVGATASAKTDLNADYSLSVTDYTLNALGQPSEIYKESTYKKDFFTLPTIYTVGASTKYNDKYTLAIDYQMQNWNPLQYKGLNYTLENSSRLSGGIEYSNKEKYYIQAGAYYGNNYLKINNVQLTDYGMTAAFGLSSKRSYLSYQLNLTYGTKGTIKNNLIRENYGQVGFIFTYRDRWLTKTKRYD